MNGIRAYPTLEQYSEVFQYHSVALNDPVLKRGRVARTSLGLPLALCGGFALTYKISTDNKNYAVRCFHKKSNLLEKRYTAISDKIKALNSSYFLPFEFQPQGIRVGGSFYPIVKMDWASGETLGEHLWQIYNKPASVNQLCLSLRGLARYLESQKIAHGDIQPGNVMVASNGKDLKLIDYDGMYVDTLNDLGSSELGLKNFQHPLRDSNCWDSDLDRFSFIVINTSLRALELKPDLWIKTKSDEDGIIFRANDYHDPERSPVFKLLHEQPLLSKEVKNLAAICRAPFEKIPNLEDFIQNRNIPQVPIASIRQVEEKSIRYISAFPVLEATDYYKCLQFVGDRVELIGKIIEVSQGMSKYGKPYIFINFAPWKGKIVKISIWSEGLEKIRTIPDSSWVGKWISVSGLMEPPFVNNRLKYSHLSISVTQSNQIQILTVNEASYRLSSKTNQIDKVIPISRNKEVLRSMESNKDKEKVNKPKKSVTPNTAVLQSMKSKQSQKVASSGMNYQKTASQSKSKEGSGCMWYIIIGFIFYLIYIFFLN